MLAALNPLHQCVELVRDAVFGSRAGPTRPRRRAGRLRPAHVAHRDPRDDAQAHRLGDAVPRAVRPLADARPQLVRRLRISNPQSSPRGRPPSTRASARMRRTVAAAGGGQLGHRRRQAAGGGVERGGRARRLDLPPRRDARERGADWCPRRRSPSGGGRGAAVRPSPLTSRIRSTRNVRRSSRVWSWAARYQRPACTTRPWGEVARRLARPRRRGSPPSGAGGRRIASARRQGRLRGHGAPLRRAAAVNSSAPSSASTRRRSVSGSARCTLASAGGAEPGEPARPSRRPPPRRARPPRPRPRPA